MNFPQRHTPYCMYGHCNDVDHSFLRSQKLLLHGTALLVDDIQGCKMWPETQMVR
jgi:hypothetical protein